MGNENKISRRSFLKNSALVGGALGTVGVGSTAFLTSCGEATTAAPKITPLKEPGTYYVPDLVDTAIDGKELKAGLIGCGGRGSGAIQQFLNAGKGLTVTALGDTFKDRLDGTANQLKDKYKIDIPENKRFVGLDAYKQVIDSGVDVVLIATPPYFRPIHFAYAVEKGKHAFLEKPIAVDAVGYRLILATAKQAAAKNLVVVTGNQRRHERRYVEAYKQIQNGLIGEITGGTVYWNGGQLWYKTRQPGWSDAEWMIRDWVNWKWLSGDHIVEQHVHNLDVFTWFSGLKPKSAVGFGSRQRRITGDQYDNFSIDFEMENGIHVHSMCRQISGCVDNVSEFIQGSKGSWYSGPGHIKDLAGNIIWQYGKKEEKAEGAKAEGAKAEEKKEEPQFKQHDPYTLEHINWVNHIRKGTPLEMASELAIANMAAIMGRESAYSGKKVTWEEMTGAPQDFTPADLDLAKKMDMSGFTVPKPGKD